MATNKTSADSTLFTGVEWNISSVTFHRNMMGKNVSLTEGNKVATRLNANRVHNCAIVFTAESLRVEQQFKVTVTKRCPTNWGAGLHVGLTREDPATSTIMEYGKLQWRKKYKDIICMSLSSFYYNDKKLCELNFSTENLEAGQSLGLLLTSEGDCHWFLDGEWRGSVPVRDFPLDQPMWGVVDVYGRCEQIRAEICTMSKYPPNYEGRLVEMGLIPKRSFFQKLFGIPPDSVQLTQARVQFDQSQASCQQLQQELTQVRERTAAEIQQLKQQLLESNTEIQRLTKISQQLIQSNQHIDDIDLQCSDAENQQLVATQRDQKDVSSKDLDLVTPVLMQEVEFWQVSLNEVSVKEDQILGQGAWGYVAKGTFRGTKVAVKQVYPEILQQKTIQRIRREIHTMAQIRHPNLVLFIAAVLNEQTGPMIVTELLDISLREAYQINRVGPNKGRIFEDVASALLYLHRQREPIIHRDVSSANILLSALPNHTWLAKLSDFGSANLVRDADTPGEGAIVYTAPEAFPQGPYSRQPRPKQTTKIDVYSFGVLACEVATQTFPKAEVFRSLLSRVPRVWGELHPLIVSCVSPSPQDRPSMDIVLQQLKRMDSEP